MRNDNFFDELIPDVNLDYIEADGLDDSGEMTIISALDRVVGKSRGSGLQRKFWQECSPELDFLCKALELTQKQVIIIGILCEIGIAVSWRQIAQFLGLTRLRAMSMTEDIDGLKEMRWVHSYAARESTGRYEGFRLTAGVVTALRKGHKFEPEKLEGFTEQEFVNRMNLYMRNEGSDNNLPLEEKKRWLLQFIEANPQLPLCSTIMNLNEENSKILLLLAVNDYSIYAGSPEEGLSAGCIDDWFDSRFDLDSVVSELTEGTQELFQLKIFEFGIDDGLVDSNRWKLTSQSHEELLGEYKPAHKHKLIDSKSNDRDLRTCKDIPEKELFYNSRELNQIHRIREIISIEEFDKVKARLNESGFRTGISCLFYGAPGTGKTETVLQLARTTGRDILYVNIAGLRDKWVGESEKNIKRVFNRYKKLCNGCANTPILLFNEADAIFGCRFQNVESSVEKMDNAIQNIILQEMETFEGILIATTNLTGNLDAAFDRRFLFKVEFDKPGTDARKSIWHSMLPEMSADHCSILAHEFEFSGGQIENIARKCKIEYITTGIHCTLSQMQEFCREEHLNHQNKRPRIGF